MRNKIRWISEENMGKLTEPPTLETPKQIEAKFS